MSNDWTESQLARAWAPKDPEHPGPAPEAGPAKGHRTRKPTVRRTKEHPYVDGWCDQCDWRSAYITPAACGLDCKEHAEANPGHTARWRRVEHVSYEAS
jgi:hypothetical protein